METNFTVSDGSTTYALMEMEIKFTGTDLDECQFTIPGVYALDATVTIYANSGSGDVVQFFGYIKDIEEIQQGVVYKYTAYEKAVELKTRPYLNSSADIFTKSSITVANLTTDILTASPTSGWALAGGMVDTTVISMNFYMVNRLQALNKLLRETRGYYVLFDSTAKTVKFLNATDVNTDRSASNLVYNTKTVLSSSMLRGITQVTVIGQDSSIRGDYGTSNTSRAYYQVDDITTSDEALKIATAIFGDIGVTYAKYQLTVSPDQISLDVRDKIKVDGSLFWITEVVQNMDEITLNIDDGKTSIIDSMGSRIHEISGDFPAGSDASWSGGNSNVAANAASYTTYVFQIQDVSQITNAMLDATISAFQVSTGVAASTDYLSDVSQIVDSTTQAGSTVLSSTTTYFPSSSGISCATMTNGHQFGMATLTGDIRNTNTSSNVTLSIQMQYKIGTGSWNSIGIPLSITIPPSASQLTCVPVSLSQMFSGQADSTAIYVRWVFTVGTNSYLYIFTGLQMNVQRVPRHIHTVSTTYDKSTSGTPPTTVQVKINSGAYQTLTPGTPIALTGAIGTLVTGKNIIYVTTPAGAGNQCSVNPTITYQTLGKS